MGLLGQHHTPIGIDVAGMCITAAQLRRRGRYAPWEIVATARYPRTQPDKPLDAAEIQRLRDVLRRQAFVGRDIVLAIPGSTLLASLVDTPPATSGAPIDTIVRNELAHAYDLGPETIEVAHWPLPESSEECQEQRVMAVGCPHISAENLIEMFESNGLRVHALDTKTWAIARGLHGTATSEMVATLDIEWEAAVLGCLCNGLVHYERTVPNTGWKGLFETVTKETNVEDDATRNYLIRSLTLESGDGAASTDIADVGDIRQQLVTQLDKLANDVQESLTYVERLFPTTPVKRLCLVGGGVTIPGLASHLQERLQVETVTQESATGPDAEMVPSIGLALYGEKIAA